MLEVCNCRFRIDDISESEVGILKDIVLYLRQVPWNVLRHVITLVELDHNYQVRHNQARYLKRIHSDNDSRVGSVIEVQCRFCLIIVTFWWLNASSG